MTAAGKTENAGHVEGEALPEMLSCASAETRKKKHSTRRILLLIPEWSRSKLRNRKYGEQIRLIHPAVEIPSDDICSVLARHIAHCDLEVGILLETP